MTTFRDPALPARPDGSGGRLYTRRSRIWKINPNLENIFENLAAGRADFPVWDCRFAGRRGGMEVGNRDWGLGSGDWGFVSGRWSKTPSGVRNL